MAQTANIDRMPGVAELQASCVEAADITVAVIDGPIDADHPVFDQAWIEQKGRAVRPADNTEPSRAHGTQVASILFGQAHGPLIGIAPDCRGLIIPVFSDAADGGIRPCSEVDLAESIQTALAEGADIINISAGRTSGLGTAGTHLSAAIEACSQKGVLVVAAAGNDGCDCMHVPAALPGVLVVGAMDDGGKPMGFSNWGEAYRSRGVLAPGQDIACASAGGGLASASGTSFATPLVAGIAALLMARLIERGREPDGALVREAIVAGAVRCEPASGEKCERYLAGSLNVPGAIEHLDKQTGKAAPVVATAHKGSVAMEQEQQIASREEQTVSTPSGGLESQLKSLETLIAGLGQNLGSLRQQTVQGPSASVPERDDGPPADNTDSITASAACCDACAAAEQRQLVFALGKLGYDFGKEARMDSIQSQMPFAKDKDGKPVFDDQTVPSATNPAHMVAFLRATPATAPALTWTLNLDQTPIYAIEPQGFFVEDTYMHLLDILEAQVTSAVEAAKTNTKKPPAPAVERMSVPGIITGQAHLMDGLVVPSIRPARAGMFAWRTDDLVKALDNFPDKGPNDPGKEGTFEPRDGLRTFLSRIYEELRNTGLSPQERALNFAATNAYQVSDIFVKLRGRNIHVEKFEVVRSPVMRPGADCWDVKMTFYDPEELNSKPREVYFYTIDVSDVIPVAVGEARHWTTF